MDKIINNSALQAYENLKKARKKYESKCSNIRVKKNTLARLNNLRENMVQDDFINYLLNLYEIKINHNK